MRCVRGLYTTGRLRAFQRSVVRYLQVDPRPTATTFGGRFFFVGLILGAINTFLFTRSIKLIELSVAYPVFSGACFALISLISIMPFGEPFRRVNILGLFLVLIGIVLITQSE